jgi:hypothetical protein
MKKFICSIALIGSLLTAGAQDDKKAEFDRKFRFGLRITPQPTWLVSGNKNNNIPNGAVFGFGFGLNLEYCFSNIACLLTGIGGDFEGGKYSFRTEENYHVGYWTDEAGEVIKPSDVNDKSLGYRVTERRVKTTYASVPLILKLSTQEYSGVKYFGMFGGELSYRVNSKANDTYYETLFYKNDTLRTKAESGELSDININPQTWFMRISFNAGMGMEYRVAGTTAMFVSINYFRNLTNYMKEESKYMFYSIENGSYKYVKSRLFITGIRFNVGIMF